MLGFQFPHSSWSYSSEKQFNPCRIRSTSGWRHGIETPFSLLALCEENPAVTGAFPLQWSVMLKLVSSLRLNCISWMLNNQLGGGGGGGGGAVIWHAMGLLPDTWNYGLRRERFSRHRGLAITTCITACAWRTCRDACRDRWLVASFEVGGGENVPGIPGACATRNFTYLVRGPWRSCDGDMYCRLSKYIYIFPTLPTQNPICHNFPSGDWQSREW